MYAIRIAHLLDTRADTTTDRAIEKLLSKGSYSTLRVVPAQELKKEIRDIYYHLAESLLLNVGPNLDERYIVLGMRRAQEGVVFSDFVLSLLAAKECLWECIEQECLQEDPQESLDLLAFVSRLFDRTIVAATVGSDSLHDRGNGHPPLTRALGRCAALSF